MRNSFFAKNGRGANCSAPGLFQVELTSRCNIDCSMCARSAGLSRPTGHMEIDLFKEIVEQSKRYNMPIGWLHHFGETLMYPHLEEALRYFKQYGLGRGAISTNAILLTDSKRRILLENASYILCCMDTMDPESYKQIRNNDFFERVRSNISRLISDRNRRNIDCKIGIQFLRTSFNEDEDIDLMMDYFGHHENVEYIEKGTVKHPRGQNIALYSSSNIRDKRIGCSMAQSQLCVLSSGDCVACCWDADGEQTIGNIRQQSLNEIWQGQARRSILESLDKGDFSNLPLCAKCAGPGEGDEARVIEQVNAYVADWKATSARVAVAPDGEAMRRLLAGSRLGELAPYVVTATSASPAAPNGERSIPIDALPGLDPDIIFVYAPSGISSSYFKLKQVCDKTRAKLVVIGSFL